MLKRYIVTATEVFSTRVEVEAKSKKEAIQKADTELNEGSYFWASTGDFKFKAVLNTDKKGSKK